MKIALTHEEAINAIRKFYEFPFDAEITIARQNERKSEIKPKISVVYPSFLESVHERTALSRIIALKNSGNKIMAIKEFRALSGFGLKEAKDAIESWTTFYQRAKELNRWPAQGEYNYVYTPV